jgi:26S proteasome regulatory subunit T5
VQRTMLELLSQLDGFSSNDKIKVIAATNRPDVLDPALLRSGRLDRKIELPHPNEEARARIMQVNASDIVNICVYMTCLFFCLYLNHGACLFVYDVQHQNSCHQIQKKNTHHSLLQIHSRKMNVDKNDVNFEELSRCCDDFNGAQVKAICVEAGMLALRREATIIKHEDFMEAIAVVAAKKKGSLDYYA